MALSINSYFVDPLCTKRNGILGFGWYSNHNSTHAEKAMRPLIGLAQNQITHFTKAS